MKLFKQLLVAPAALGLLAPVAATAAEFNLDGVNKYASEEQVTSISQFSDVKPTDWAYQALSNLIERYGCVAGYPDSTYKGGKAMTRFEAAALLNACLDRVTEVTDELKKLMAEFEKELAILKGRVDGLEAKVGQLEANQFSTTTKLKGIATMVLGGASNQFRLVPGTPAQTAFYGQLTGTSTTSTPVNQGSLTGTLRQPGPQSFGVINGAPLQGTGTATIPAGIAIIPGTPDRIVRANDITFNYDVRLNLDTSFTGKDLLRTTLRAGNFANSVFGNGNTALEVAFQEDADGPGGVDTVGINRLFYQFPIGENFTATFGAKVRQDDMLAMWPSAYPTDSILDLFTYGGARGAYSLNLGGGIGLWYEKDGFSISANYVSNEVTAENSTLGVGDALTATLQLGYAASNWGAAFAYTYADSSAEASGFSANSIGLSGYWQPSDASWMPSISAGFGYNDVDTFFALPNSDGESWSWMVGLQWADAFIKGNALGMAIGSAGQSAVGGFGTGGIWTDRGEETLAYELWYKFQVTDNISVTPAFFWIGNDNNAFGNPSGADTFGGLIKTTFKF